MPTILLADDETPLRNLLSRFLTANGFEVHTAANGIEALALGSQYSDSIDLVIADVRMPGMAGPEVARRLKDRRPQLRVLFISGYTDRSELDAPLLQKPFALPVLLGAVRKLLGFSDTDTCAQARGR